MAIPRRSEIPVDGSLYPHVQYHSGNTTKKDEKGKWVKSLAGFTFPTGTEHDDIIEEAGFGKVTVKHTGGKESNIVEYWYLGEEITVFPIYEGLVGAHAYAMIKQQGKQAQMGIFSFEENYTNDDGKKTKKTNVKLLGLLRIGNTGIPVVFGAKGTLTGGLVKALLAHMKVCATMDTIVYPNGDGWVAPGEAALTLAVANDTESVGSGSKTDVYPIVHRHPEDLSVVTNEYVNKNKLYRPKGFLPTIEQLYTDAPAWAKSTLSAALERAKGNGQSTEGNNEQGDFSPLEADERF